MAVNLSKNGPALMAAYKDVVDGKSDTNWALFTYEGNSNDIRLAEKGDGGLEEMVEELNSGKVMYAFCRIQEPNSGLPKYVLINWMGDGVKDSRKGSCANHLTSMSNFLKGAHVTINARAEDDVDPEDILKKVAKASGIHFNFNKQTQERRDALPGPVGSVYRKVNAVEEIQQTSKNDFWDQAEREEKIRRREETQRLEEERRTREKERTETEERQSRERERRTRERAQQIEREKTYQRQREEEEREREQQRQGAHVTINARAEDDVDPEDILKKSSEVNFSFNKQTQERRDALPGPVGSVYRKVNAVEEIQQTSKNDFWDQAEREEKICRREETQRLEEERRTREKERTETEERQSRERERRTRERAQQIEREKTYQRQREEEEREREQQRQIQQDDTSKRTGINFTASVQKANEAKSLIAQRSINPRDVFKQRQQSFEVNGDLSPAAHRPGKLQSPFLSQRSLEMEQPQYPPWTFSTHLSPASPVRPYSPAAPVSPAPAVMAGSPLQAADPVYEEESSDEFDEDADEPTREEDPSQDNIYEALPSTQTAGEEDLYENVHTSIADDNTKPDGQEQEVTAVALYDYQAVDDSEINFDPGDIITGIEMLDEGWWRGFGPGGHWGMFPANYVQLL